MRWLGLLCLLAAAAELARCDSDWFYQPTTTPVGKTNLYAAAAAPMPLILLGHGLGKTTSMSLVDQFYNFNYYNIQSLQPAVEEARSPNACPSLDGVCYCSTRIGGIFCSNLTRHGSEPIKFEININSNAFSISYFLVVGQETGESQPMINLKGDQFDLSNMRLSSEFYMVIDRVGSIALDWPLLPEKSSSEGSERHLYLDNFDLNFEFEGKPLNGDGCWKDSLINKSRTFLSGFNQVHIGFTSQTSYLRQLCPLIFSNVNLQGLYLYNQTFDDGFKFMAASESKDKALAKSFKSSIDSLFIDSSVIDLNENFLNKHVFKNLKKIFIRNSLINSVDLSLFVDQNRLQMLESIEMSVKDLAFFLDFHSSVESGALINSPKASTTNSTSRRTLSLVFKDFQNDYICLLKNMADYLVSLQTMRESDSKTIEIRLEMDEGNSQNCSCSLSQYLNSWSRNNSNIAVGLRFKVTDRQKEPIKCARKSLNSKNRCDISSIINRSCKSHDTTRLSSKKPPTVSNILSSVNASLSQTAFFSNSAPTTTSTKAIKNSSAKTAPNNFFILLFLLFSSQYF